MTQSDTPAPVVALSVGDSQDLDRHGYGPEHIDEAVMRLGQAVLRAGARIGYGGALRGGENFLTTLIGVASKSPRAQGRTPEPEATLINYSAWPFYGFIDEQTQARLYGAVRFVRVDPPDTSPVPPADPKSKDPTHAWLAARALTRMRRLMVTGGPDDHHDPRFRSEVAVPRCVARVALGGRVSGWQGMLPGVAEEIVADLDAGAGVFLIGAFGGCVRRLVDALLAPTPAGAAEHLRFLELDFHLAPLGLTPDTDTSALDTAHRDRVLADPFGRTWLGADGPGREELARGFVHAHAVALATRDDLTRLNNGLSVDDSRRLMRTQDVSTMRRLVLRGLRGLGSLPEA